MKKHSKAVKGALNIDDPFNALIPQRILPDHLCSALHPSADEHSLIKNYNLKHTLTQLKPTAIRIAND